MKVSPWVKCPACGKLHAAVEFKFTCLCGQEMEVK